MNTEYDKKWRPNKKQEEFLSLPDDVFEALYGGAAGGGKGFSVNTLIPTPFGLKPISDIHPGELVYHPSGQMTQVVAEQENNLSCYEVTFDCGTKIVCDETHLWHVFSNADREALYKRTNEYQKKRKISRKSTTVYRRSLSVTLNPDENRGRTGRSDLAERNANRIYNYKPVLGKIKPVTEITYGTRPDSIRLTSAIFNIDKKLKVDPYVLGVWLGDGSINSGRITGVDQEIFEEIERRKYTVFHHKNKVSHYVSFLSRKLASIGVLGDKRIPKNYLFGSITQRLDLLKGLMDTDGYCAEDGGCELALSKEDLANDALILVRSLGIKASMTRNEAWLYDEQKKYRFRIKFTTTYPVFILERKLKRQKQELKTTQTWHYIVLVKSIPSVPTKCIQVDAEDGMFLVSEAFIPTHNSEVLLMLPFTRRFYENPKFKGIIFRRTYPELESSLIMRSKTGIGRNGPSYEDFGGTYNGTKHIWTFPSGATIMFSYMETNDDARSHKTSEYNYIGFDELTAFDEFQYVYLTSRCRTSDPELPAIIRAASNPEGIGLTWVRKRFVEPYPSGFKRIYDRDSKSSRVFIPAKLADNPDLMEADPAYVNRLRILPEAEQKALIEGNWFIFSGQVFPEFRLEPIPGEPDNACHVIQPFEIPSWWPKIIACDWGYAHQTCILWAAVNPEGQVIVYREYVSKKEYISTWASNLRRLSQFDENIVAVVLDPSAWQNRGTEKTIADQFHDFSLFNPEKADNDRLGGKLLTHEFLRWRQRPERFKPSDGYSEVKALEILRKYGTEAVTEYKKMFLPDKPETNLPRLRIFPYCKNLLKTIPLMVYNQEANDPLKAEDVAKMDGDDPYDTLRYLLKAVDRYVLRVQKDAEKRVELQGILSAYGKEQDATHFYMEMAAYDKKNSRANSSISRYKQKFN